MHHRVRKVTTWKKLNEEEDEEEEEEERNEKKSRKKKKKKKKGAARGMIDKGDFAVSVHASFFSFPCKKPLLSWKSFRRIKTLLFMRYVENRGVASPRRASNAATTSFQEKEPCPFRASRVPYINVFYELATSCVQAQRGLGQRIPSLCELKTGSLIREKLVPPDFVTYIWSSNKIIHLSAACAFREILS